MNKKTSLLRELINSSKLEFLMEAHNGLSAKIVEEAGFKGIWGSGLSISASLGLRDNNEASWTQILDVCEYMSDATKIPILLDGDTGFGNFNNMRRLVKKLEQRDIAGVCIEDKLFPKSNSFVNSNSQSLADIEEFCGKIKVAKDTQIDKDFCVVARVEAFIVGLGIEEVLIRAESYRKAGADAILIHSKKNNSSEIELFMKKWDNRHPVIIVPTKYYATPTEVFENIGIDIVIWANQTLRSSITSMQKTVKKIYFNENILSVEDDIVSVNEVFRLQEAEELLKAEEKYLFNSENNFNVIILAASQGDLGVLTKEIPKTLIKIKNDKTILDNQINSFNKFGIKNINVVRGFAKEKFHIKNLNYIDNDDFMKTSELYSLYLAKNFIQNNTIITFGDIVFKEYLINILLETTEDIEIIVDVDYLRGKEKGDFIIANMPFSKKSFFSKVKLIKAVKNRKNNIDGEFIGLWKISNNGSTFIKNALEELSNHSNFKNLTLIDLFNRVSKDTDIVIKYIKGSWLDVNTIVDLQNLNKL